MQKDFRKKRLAILPDSGRDLLRAEISLALESMGFEALRVRPDELTCPESQNYLPRLIEKKPELFISVNLQGLIPGSINIRPLLETGVPVLAWFVDNPWHLLSAMRDPSWKELNLAVTDHTFIAPLKAAGAAKVSHLPLGGCPTLMQAPENISMLAEKHRPETSLTIKDGKKDFLGLDSVSEHRLNLGQGQAKSSSSPADFLSGSLKPVVFAGRSAFPGLDEFFAGQKVPEELLAKAAQLLKAGFRNLDGQKLSSRPDFAWWVRELGLEEEQERFWPGKMARKPGKGAVASNARWRRLCIDVLADGLTVFGDSGWGTLVDLHPPVDYYTELPSIYATADYSLNLNSLLLPAGLSQRIFDVWLAGGFCITDWNAGLDIFPPELVSEITFNQPEELPELVARLSATSSRKGEIRRAWKQEILTRHTYEKRMETALRGLDLI